MMTDSKKTVRVVARFKARTDCGPQLGEVLKTLVEPTCREEGCLLYQLHVNPNDPTDLVFIEEWASEDALRLRLPLTRKFLRLPDLRRGHGSF